MMKGEMSLEVGKMDLKSAEWNKRPLRNRKVLLRKIIITDWKKKSPSDERKMSLAVSKMDLKSAEWKQTSAEK